MGQSTSGRYSRDGLFCSRSLYVFLLPLFRRTRDQALPTIPSHYYWEVISNASIYYVVDTPSRYEGKQAVVRRYVCSCYYPSNLDRSVSNDIQSHATFAFRRPVGWGPNLVFCPRSTFFFLSCPVLVRRLGGYPIFRSNHFSYLP